MKVVIIDGHGGKIGAQLVERVKTTLNDAEVYAVGLNGAATAAMLRAGADHGATGENPVLVCARDADVIAGPIGIISANSFLGELTPAMARAVGESSATKLLLPMNKCGIVVIGTEKGQVSDYLNAFTEALRAVAGS